MTQMRTIEIDFDVHQKIELERRSFEEPPNDALRRLLKLGPSKPATLAAGIDKPTNGRAWSGKRVVLPHGTQVRMQYNGHVHVGLIDDGSWLVEGSRYKSPSDAAGHVAMTKAGTTTSLNGWLYWQVKRPGDDSWIDLKTLRPV